jgi:hypothetical protein
VFTCGGSSVGKDPKSKKWMDEHVSSQTIQTTTSTRDSDSQAIRRKTRQAMIAGLREEEVSEAGKAEDSNVEDGKFDRLNAAPSNAMVVSVNAAHLPIQHQTSPGLPSTSMTSAQTHGQEHALDAASAVETVFGITELLLLIVSEVPIYERILLRQVSKRWQDVIENEEVDVLEPIGYECDPHGTGSMQGLPVYLVESKNVTMRPNFNAGFTRSLLRNYESTHLASAQHVRQVVLRLKDWDQLVRHRTEFITDPPVKQVMVRCTVRELTALEEGPRTVVRVRQGIRVGHLLAYFERFNQGVTDYHVRFAWKRKLDDGETLVTTW